MQKRAAPLFVPLLALMLVAFLLAGCGGDESGSSGELRPPPGWPSVEERTLAEGTAPTPFTAAQLREATPTLLEIVSVVEERDGKTLHAIQRFDEVDERGAVVTFYSTDLAGHTLGVGSSRAWRWEELQRRSATPATETVISQESVQVPAGTYECMRYVVRSRQPKKPPPGAPPAQPQADQDPDEDPDEPETEEVVDRMWFAYDLPGPPIQWIRIEDGVQVMKMMLVSRRIIQPEGGQRGAK